MDQQRMNSVSAVTWLLAGPAALLGALVFLKKAPPFVEPWLGSIVAVAAWSLAAWGAYWTLMCLLGLAATLPRRRGPATHAHAPRWAGRLPRRAVLSAALASSLLAAAVAPAHAAGTGQPTATLQTSAALHPSATLHTRSTAQPAAPLPLDDSTGRTSTSSWASAASGASSSGTTSRDAGWPVTPEEPQQSGTEQASTDGYTAQRSAQDLPRSLGSPGRDTVLVRHGDTLWDIAARHLGPSATSADIAHEWPLWYQANREEIGSDPDLLLPGQMLHPPR